MEVVVIDEGLSVVEAGDNLETIRKSVAMLRSKFYLKFSGILFSQDSAPNHEPKSEPQ